MTWSDNAKKNPLKHRNGRDYIPEDCIEALQTAGMGTALRSLHRALRNGGKNG